MVVSICDPLWSRCLTPGVIKSRAIQPCCPTASLNCTALLGSQSCNYHWLAKTMLFISFCASKVLFFHHILQILHNGPFKMPMVSSINKQHMDSRWRAHVNIDEYKSIRHFGGQRKSELNSEIKMHFFSLEINQDLTWWVQTDRPSNAWGTTATEMQFNTFLCSGTENFFIIIFFFPPPAF